MDSGAGFILRDCSITLGASHKIGENYAPMKFNKVN